MGAPKEEKTLQNKIDFAVIFSVNGANPNGDPLDGNRPRKNNDNMGEVSDVCIKRKIRNRLMEAGQKIFVQSDDNKVDEHPSLRARQLHFEKEFKVTDKKNSNKNGFIKAVCSEWIDVRSFGQVFAYGKDKDAEDSQGISIGIRGPVSVHPAFSIAPVSSRISSLQITKSVSGEGDGTKKASDTMGMKHRVDHGLYKFCGAINPQLASKTWFNDEDAKEIHESLKNLFDNDESSARPAGSMEVVAVFWWQHNVKHGQYSSAQVHRSLDVNLKNEGTDPKKIEDYSIKLKSLAGLEPEIFNPNNVAIERI
ncbi:MAG: type I-C CRISPR-associated protein Cas7/Csd2 [Nitrospirae bacterium]|nr:type I-C CRISPR-associated protein Cas7/Csd2 [Nitrospirota bacterium]